MATDLEYENFFRGLAEIVEVKLAIRREVAEGVAVLYGSFLKDAHSIVSAMVSEMVPTAVSVMAEVERNPWVNGVDEESMLREMSRRKRENPGENPVDGLRAVLETLRGAGQEAK
jgi:hypothetical protein